jgi:hypothetical protein
MHREHATLLTELLFQYLKSRLGVQEAKEKAGGWLRRILLLLPPWPATQMVEMVTKISLNANTIK